MIRLGKFVLAVAADMMGAPEVAALRWPERHARPTRAVLQVPAIHSVADEG